MTALQEFLSFLRYKNEIVEVSCSVDPHLEIAEIHRRVVASGGPALLFTDVIGSSFPVVTNLFGSQARVDYAFSSYEPKTVSRFLDFFSKSPSLSSCWQNRDLVKRLFKLGLKKKRLSCYYKEPSLDLNSLPFLTSWPEDGGPFLTLPLVYTESPLSGIPNLGMYRMQRFDSQTTGLHFQIQKGGGLHFHEAEQLNQNLSVNVFLGGNPFLILSAIAPLPEKISEILFCSFLMGKKLFYGKSSYNHYPLFSDCEFILFGKAVKNIRQPEGPFGDHYGYYSLTHDFPIFKCSGIYHAKKAVFPATIVGKPKQEDFYLGEKLQEFLSPLIPFVMPGVIQLKSYGETGFHSLSGAIVKERYKKETLTSALRILGEGQLSLTKFLLVTDRIIDLNDFKTLFRTILERFCPSQDFIIFPYSSQDTLDYTGPELNMGSKAILMGLGPPIRILQDQLEYRLPNQIKNPKVFCPGCLVIEIEPSVKIEELYNFSELQEWPIVVISDNATKTSSNKTSFLWRVFTRFEPASDIYFKTSGYKRHSQIRKLPIFIDARMKNNYPKEVFADKHTKDIVSKKWSQYFPNGQIQSGDYDDI